LRKNKLKRITILIATKKGRNMSDMREVTDEEMIDTIFSLPRAIVFKHSPNCGISAHARMEMDKYLSSATKEIPAFMINVIGQRECSKKMAERSCIRHESPQVFYLENGKVKYHASHFSITGKELEKACEGKEE
jgi:bacillithiol system protein YtxJ